MSNRKMCTPTICYVSAFVDIGRSKWTYFSRDFARYMVCFRPYIAMFKNLEEKNVTDYHMIVYISENVAEKFKEEITTSLIQVHVVNEEFLSKNTIWSRLDRETEIIHSVDYMTLVSDRLIFPENSNPKYTLINHAKIDFVCLAMNHTDAPYLCWTDFGYFSNTKNIPYNPLDVEKLDKERVNYTLINQISELDQDIIYTIKNAPEKIGGFFFFGNRNILKQYQQLYHKMHLQLQDKNLVDDDQHLALRCYFENPDMFCLHMLGGWHKALTHFQL